MKYITRILAFLFIGFSSCFAFITSQSSLESSIKEWDEIVSWTGGCKDPGDTFSDFPLYDIDVGEFSDDRFFTLSGYIFWACSDGQGCVNLNVSSNLVASSPFQCTYFTQYHYTSEKKPKCPAGQYALKGSYNETCTSDCGKLSNRRDRLDCYCNQFGKGGYVSSDLSFVPKSDNSGSQIASGVVQCQNGSFDDSDLRKYFSELKPDFNNNHLDNIVDVTLRHNDYPIPDLDNGSATGGGDLGGGSGTGSGGGTEQGGGEPQVDVSQCESTKSAIISSLRNYNSIYRDAGVDCSDSGATVAARDMKRSLENRISNFNASDCAGKIGEITFSVSAFSCKTDPSKPDPVDPPTPQDPTTPQEPSKETISYNENTNTVTITDPNTGKTQTVTPTNVTKNDKGEMQTIKYTDPETGKTIEYKAKEDGTWERIENPGSGTGEGRPGGSTEGEGSGTSEDGKKDGNEDGEGNFEGGELGAIGNANDFDKGGELAGLYDSLTEKESENEGILGSIISDGFGLIDDIKESIDNIKETSEELRNNPFSSSNVVSCAIDLNILDQSSQIDLCKYTSQFKPLFSSIFFVFLNIMVGFAFFKILVLLLINI